jgi:mannose/fructose/N-acetylgalactosamine-specific phosphotransferase system component IIC
LIYGLAIGAAAGYYVGQADIWNRKLNIRIMHFFEPGIIAGKQSCIFGAQITAITAKFLRDFIVYILLFGIGIELASKIYNSFPQEVLEGLSRALWLMPAIGLAVIYEAFRSKLGAILHAVIFIVCYLLLVFSRSVSGWFMLLAVVTVCIIAVYNFVWDKKGV